MPTGSPNALSFGSAMILAEYRAETFTTGTAEREKAREEAKATSQIHEAERRGAQSPTSQIGGEILNDPRQMDDPPTNLRGTSVASGTRSQARLI